MENRFFRLSKCVIRKKSVMNQWRFGKVFVRGIQAAHLSQFDRPEILFSYFFMKFSILFLVISTG